MPNMFILVQDPCPTMVQIFCQNDTVCVAKCIFERLVVMLGADSKD